MASFPKHIFSLIPRKLSYQSATSLRNLYPNSSLRLTTPTKPNCETSDIFNGVIPIDKINIIFNPNTDLIRRVGYSAKTNVEIRFQVATADWLRQDVRDKLIAKNQSKISKDGYLIVQSDLTRSQHMNVAHALEKLRTLIRNSSESSVRETEAMSIQRVHEQTRQRLLRKRK